MEKMKKLEYEILSIQELYAFARRTMGLLYEHVEDDAFISSVSSLMNSSLNRLSVILGLLKENEFTEKLAEREQARDKAFIGLFNLIKANINHENDEIAMSAQNVYFIFEQNHLVQSNKGNNSFNKKINFLLDDLEKYSIKNELEKTGILPWIKHLDKTHHEYLKFLEEIKDEESIKLIPILKSERGNIVQYLTGLFGYIEIYKESKRDNFAFMADKLNEIIIDIMIIARKRGKTTEKMK